MIGFGFASHWLKNWRDSFKPITKRSNRNHVITFDSHLKTALTTEHCDWLISNDLFVSVCDIANTTLQQLRQWNEETGGRVSQTNNKRAS